MADRIRVRVRPKEGESDTPMLDVVKSLVLAETSRLENHIKRLEERLEKNKNITIKVTKMLYNLAYDLAGINESAPTRNLVLELIRNITESLEFEVDVCEYIDFGNSVEPSVVENVPEIELSRMARRLADDIDDFTLEQMRDGLEEDSPPQRNYNPLARDITVPESIVRALSNPIPQETIDRIYNSMCRVRLDVGDDLMDTLSQTPDELDLDPSPRQRRRRRR